MDIFSSFFVKIVYEFIKIYSWERFKSFIKKRFSSFWVDKKKERVAKEKEEWQAKYEEIKRHNKELYGKVLLKYDVFLDNNYKCKITNLVPYCNEHKTKLISGGINKQFAGEYNCPFNNCPYSFSRRSIFDASRASDEQRAEAIIESKLDSIWEVINDKKT